MKKALITRVVSNQYTVFLDREFQIATAMGKLRLGKKPIVGDYVMVETLDNRLVIQEVLERKNQLIRPLIANIDQALVVMSALEPDFSYTLVDRLIFLIAYESIEPVIVISKSDLITDEQLQAIVNEYEPYGYRVVCTGQSLSTDSLEAILKDKVSVLSGQSGVGKSSLLNRIDAELKLNTQEISKALGRGKHTTRHNQLYRIADGWIADTPGFSSLSFSNLDPLDFSQRIPDFKPYEGHCKYRDCLHIHEPGCTIKQKVDEKAISLTRYQHYVDCIKLIKEESR